MIEFPSNLNLSESDKNYISKVLPKEWETKIIYFSLENNEIHLIINAKTVNEANKWFESYQNLTKTFYSIQNGSKAKGQRIIYKKRYNCIHKTRHPEKFNPINNKSIKNLNCPASLIITIKQCHKRYQGKDKNKKPEKNKPCEIKIKFQHNHTTDDINLIKFQKVNSVIKNELWKLFEFDYKPGKALNQLRNIIKNKFNNEYNIPGYNYCYNLYNKYLNTKFEIIDGKINNEEGYLNNFINNYNCKLKDICAEFAVTETGYIVCVCPPISKRAHVYEPSSSKIVFIDTFCSNNQFNNRIYVLLTPSESGILPLGLILTSIEDLSLLQIGFSMLKDLLDATAFNGNQTGPKTFITNEFLSTETLLPTVWPNSQIYISTYHVLQNIWKWLSSVDNNISESDKTILFRDFYNILYASNQSEFENYFEISKESSKKYENYQNLLDEYLINKEKWAFYLRTESIKFNYLKFSEITIRFIKDKLFQNLDDKNFIELVNFATNSFYQYFENRLNNITNKFNDNNEFFFNVKLPDKYILDNIQKFAQNMCFIPTEQDDETYYIVNTDLFTCTCANSNSKTICIHAKWIYYLNYSQEFFKHTSNPDVLKKLYKILTGKTLDINKINKNNEINKINEQKDKLIENLFQNIDDNHENNKLIAKNECKNIWKNITNKFENLASESSQNLLPIVTEIASKFDQINDVSELRKTFNIFD